MRFDLNRDFTAPGRSAAISGEAMVATSHWQASQWGIEVLRAGGNAVDASVGIAALLAVIEPAMTGIGGDCFALYKPKDRPLVALNGSGRAPAALDCEAVLATGTVGIDPESAHSVTVPGAVDAWCRLHEDHGSLPLDFLFRAAIDAAREGAVLQPRVAFDFATHADKLLRRPATRAIFCRDGAALGAGDRLVQPQLAATLQAIARGGRDAFYAGRTAERLVGCLRDHGGLHTAEDFARQRADYVEPIATAFCGHTVHECPPNGQGLTALMMLAALDGWQRWLALKKEVDRIDLFARLTAACYAFRDARIADADSVPADLAACALSGDSIEQLRAASEERRSDAPMVLVAAEHRDTTCFSVVDRDGNAVSFINSLFHGFGSGILEPETGVLLHCRGAGFCLVPGHPNELAGGKRPLHTLVPGMLCRDGEATMPFGVMGGQYQAAGHAHFLSHVLQRGDEPQKAAARPRHFNYGGALTLETTVSRQVARGLAARGHRVQWADGPIGGAQAIWIDRERGLLIGATEHRRDGAALGL